MSVEVLNKLLISEIPEVVTAAQRADVITSKFQSGELTKSEFDELIDDITKIDNIDRNMVNIEIYREIKQAFDVIMTLKSLTSLF